VRDTTLELHDRGNSDEIATFARNLCHEAVIFPSSIFPSSAMALYPLTGSGFTSLPAGSLTGYGGQAQKACLSLVELAVHKASGILQDVHIQRIRGSPMMG